MDNTVTPLEAHRHSLAHLLAAAILALYPQAKRTIGPAIDNGFYYDFDFGTTTISDSDLATIEAKMKELLATWSTFERAEVSSAEAEAKFADNEYKLELIKEFSGEGQTLSLYTSGPPSGEFTDLCRGGHTQDMREVEPDSFKLD